MNIHLLIKALGAGRIEIEAASLDRRDLLERSSKSPLLTVRTIELEGAPAADGGDRWRIWRRTPGSAGWHIVTAGPESAMRSLFDALVSDGPEWTLTKPGNKPHGVA